MSTTTTAPTHCLNYGTENDAVARDLNAHLALPSYATVTTRLPKHNGRVAAMEDVRALRKTLPNIATVSAIHRRDKHLHLAMQCETFAKLARQEAQDQHGDNGEPNPTPVSGGICEHWPRQTKDIVTAYVRLHHAHRALALAWHHYAGKRTTTFPTV